MFFFQITTEEQIYFRMSFFKPVTDEHEPSPVPGMIKIPRGWLTRYCCFCRNTNSFYHSLSDKISFGKLKQPSITLSDIFAVGLESVGLLTTSRKKSFQGFLLNNVLYFRARIMKYHPPSHKELRISFLK